MLVQVEGEFFKTVDQYNQDKEGYFNKIIALGCVLVPVMIGLMVLELRSLIEGCKLGRKAFLILPKRLLSHQEASKTIKKNKIVSAMEWMAL